LKRIHLFKAGTHTAMSGQTLDFSEEELRRAAQVYDPARHEAPIVIGHPQTNAPAWGWVQQLDYADGELCATPHEVDEQFAELVKGGKFKKVSASWYLPDAPNNPVPGSLYLRHIGFLGAQPPAVKGLKPVEFADAEGTVEFSAALNDSWLAGMFQRLRDWLISKEGLEQADQVIPQWQIDSVKEMALRDELQGADSVINDLATGQPIQTSFSDPTKGTSMSKTVEQLERELQEERARREAAEAASAQFAERERKARREAVHADNEAFADRLVAQAKLAPAGKGVIVALLDAVAAPDAVVEFGEGDAKKSLASAFKELLEGASPVVDFGEHATRGNASGAGALDPVALGKKAADYVEEQRARGVTVTVQDAIAHVSKQAD
jgi:hypothetical protein